MIKAIVTGGAGFIGSAFIRHAVLGLGWRVLNVDKLTYAGNLETLTAVGQNPNYTFLQEDICNRSALKQAIFSFQPLHCKLCGRISR